MKLFEFRMNSDAKTSCGSHAPHQSIVYTLPVWLINCFTAKLKEMLSLQEAERFAVEVLKVPYKAEQMTPFLEYLQNLQLFK